MIQQFEYDYAGLLTLIQDHGDVQQTRNSETKSLFGLTLNVPVQNNLFPLLQGRKIYYKGVFGELAAMLRKPKHIDDFRKWGCNFWDLWAKEDGSIVLDYGNAWHDGDQITKLKNALANNPTDRRMIISGWRPERLDDLDLPCCHLLYQFYVRENKYLDMIWYQRSVDMMVGLPSNITFAAAWLIALANNFSYEPGNITMMLGNCHIYDKHYKESNIYLDRVYSSNNVIPEVKYVYTGYKGKDFCEFEPNDIHIINYKYFDPIKLELLA